MEPQEDRASTDAVRIRSAPSGPYLVATHKHHPAGVNRHPPPGLIGTREQVAVILKWVSAYGRPVQAIDANITEDPVRYYVELPEKSATTQEWLESIRLEDADRSLVNGVAAAVDDEQT